MYHTMTHSAREDGFRRRALAGVIEFAPALHEMIRATARIGTKFGFELEGEDGAVDATTCGLPDKRRVLDIGGFGVAPAVRPHLLEGFAGVGQFAHLFGAALAVPGSGAE